MTREAIMDERQALLAAIVANPDEDTPRLAFADWLQEHGDEHDQARAEFIRSQVQEAPLPEDSPERKKLGKLAAPLHKKHARAWLGGLWANCELRDFERGLLANWHVTAGNFLKQEHQKAVCEWFPRVGVNSLLLSERTKQAGDVALSPALEWVGWFAWLRAGLGDDGMKALAASPHTWRTSKFLVSNPTCSDAGVKAFAKSKCWPALRRFGLLAGARTDRFGYRGILAVLESDRFPLLEELNVGGKWLAEATGRADFFASPALARLRDLGFDGPVDLGRLAATPRLTRLEKLSINSATISDADAHALSDSPALGKLKKLALHGMNAFAERPSAAAEKRLRDRFGERLSLHYSPTSRRG